MELLQGINGVYYLLVCLVLGLIVERMFPWRGGVNISLPRWLRNASLTFYNTLILSFIPMIAGYGSAVFAQEQSIGLLNIQAAPIWIQLLFAVVVLDLASYGQHRALHHWYFLWRSHRTHHTDRYLDATTALRFHPFEAVFRTATEAPIIFMLGLPPEGILLTYAVHVFVNVFTHANISISPAIDRALAIVLVTPNVHHLHHSTKVEHQYANFGSAFTIWDRALGTYVPPSELAKDEVFGVDGPENIAEETFGNLVLDPFRTPEKSAIPKPAKK